MSTPEYMSNGRPVRHDGPIPLTDEIMSALRARRYAPYIADLAGGSFAIVVAVGEWEVLAGNADGWLPSDARGGQAYGAVVSANLVDDSGDFVTYLDEREPATCDEYVAAMVTAINAHHSHRAFHADNCPACGTSADLRA